MNAFLLMLIVSAVLVVLGFIGIGRGMRRIPEGQEREELRGFSWLMGGLAALVLSMALGELPVAVPAVTKWIGLGSAIGFIATGQTKLRRLANARQVERLRAAASATTLVDRIGALEGMRTPYQEFPLGRRVPLLGGKLMVVGTSLWALNLLQGPTAFLIFGPLAAVGIGWLGWDVISAIRRKAIRDRIDGEISKALDRGSLPETGKGVRQEL